MRAVAARFIGDGNTRIADGSYLGWQVICSSCGISKTVTNHKNSSMSPDDIVKRLLQSGWYIGHKSDEDLCGGCRHKRPERKVEETPSHSLKWDDANEYFAHIRACVERAKTAFKAQQHQTLASCLDECLGRLDSEVIEAVLATQRASEPQPVADAAPMAQPVKSQKRVRKPKQAPQSQPQPVEEDVDFNKWLAADSHRWQSANEEEQKDKEGDGGHA
jgi:hypothetical protein